MSDRLCLFGNGEHARVVHEAAVLGGWIVAGAWAPQPAEGLTWLGDDGRLARERDAWRDAAFHGAFVGSPGSRQRRQVIAAWPGLRWATVIHPTAFVSPSARLGVGVFIGPRAVVHTGAVIDDHVIVNSAAIVEHDARVGVGTHLAPGGIIGGGVVIGAWCTIGLGAVVRDHVRVGDDVVVAMGGAVVADVPAGAVVFGVPARQRAT